MSALSVMLLLAAAAVLCTVVALVVGSPIPDLKSDRAQLRRDDEGTE